MGIAIVSKRMRHSTMGLTNDTYGHLIGEAAQKAARAAVAQVPRRNNPSTGTRPPAVGAGLGTSGTRQLTTPTRSLVR
jgi:hypothetical protein